MMVAWLKVSYTTAFTVSMLSWSYFNFKEGFKASNNLEFGANTMTLGADYLLKATIGLHPAGAAGPAQTLSVAQVSEEGARTSELCSRPEPPAA